MSDRSGRPVRHLLVLLAAASSLVLGACGGGSDASPSGGAAASGSAGGGAPTPGAASAGAPSGSAAGGGAASGGSYRSAAELGHALATAVRAKGSVAVEAKGAGGVTAHRSLQWSGGRERLMVSLDMPGSARKSVLVVDGTAYAPTTESALGKHWLLLTPDMLRSSPLVTATFGTDLASSYEALGTSIGFQDGGTTGSGADRGHDYTLTVGPETARALIRLDRVPKDLRAAMQKNIAQAHYTVTITVGDDDLPRKQTTSGTGTGATETFSKWGQVSVPVPAANDVLKA